MSEILDQARKYEKEECGKIKKESRPAFHFSNPVGWMNDPNGFSDYKGEHHLFLSICAKMGIDVLGTRKK